MAKRNEENGHGDVVTEVDRHGNAVSEEKRKMFAAARSQKRFDRIYGRVLRGIAAVTSVTTAWFLQPTYAFAEAVRLAHPPVPHSLLPKGLTQTPDADLQQKIDGKEAKEKAQRDEKKQPDVRTLSASEMKHVFGRGPYRNRALSGTLPWQMSFRDVNTSNGNLFKSFTDIQVAPGRGQGLALQRTYNSDDDREGAFGIGWSHAYDIRMEEAAPNPTTGDEQVVRTDFFGGKHTYTRDADGLYSPPPYLYDETSSDYDTSLASGPTAPLDDTDKGMDGTVKHFVTVGTLSDGSVNHTLRACDYIQDRHGNQTNLTYGQAALQADGSTTHLLTQVTDPVGRTLTFHWQNLGTVSAPHWRIVQVDSPGYPGTVNSYRVTYDYYLSATDTGAGGVAYQLKAVHLNPDGLNRTTSYAYTSYSSTGGTENGLLASIADPLGHTVSYAYTLPSYNPLNTVWVTQVVESAGIDSAGSPRTNTWNCYVEQGTVDATTAIGVAWYLYQAGVTSNNGVNFMTETYSDSQLRATWLIGKMGQAEYQRQYDINNNVTCSGFFRTWQGQYQPHCYTWATYGPHGNVLTQYYEGAQSQQTVTTYYDASKYFQKASVTDANNHTTTFDYYDDQDPSPGNRGEVKWVRDAGYSVANNPSYGKEFDYTYNPYGQKASESNLKGVVTQYTYGDAYGNLTQVVQDPSNPAIGYAGLNRTTSMAYDLFGRVTSSTDPNTKTSSFSYNTLGQPTSAAFPATASTAAETVSYGYGMNGRTESVTDGRGTTGIAYEAGCDRVSSVTDPVTGTVGYTYMPTGERASLSLPNGGGTWNYVYTPVDYFSSTNPYNDGVTGTNNMPFPGNYYTLPKCDPNSLTLNLQSIVDGQGRRVDVLTQFLGQLWKVRYDQTFDSSGNVTQFCEETYTYDILPGTSNHASDPGALLSHYWLTQLQTTFYYQDAQKAWHTHVLSQNNYSYDNTGQRLSNQITTSLGSSRTEQYGYDEQNRLKTVNYGDGETQGYGFDAMGNRLSKNDTGSYGNESYAFDAANRLTSVASSGPASGSYTNDANGNTLTGGGRVNTWDSQNRLVQVVKGGVTSAFTYGSDGLRRRSVVTQTDGTKTQTDSVYDNSMLVEEIVRHFDASNVQIGQTDTVTYFQGASGPLYRKSSLVTDPIWYVYDGLGSVVGEVNVTGTVTGSKLYDVYGATRSLSGSPTSRQGFVGQLGHESDDETGLVYMRARYYDPLIGRFASEDPARNGNNWYAYGDSNPTNKVDKNGKCAFLIAALLSGLVTGIINALVTGVEGGNWKTAFWAGFAGGFIATIPYIGPAVGAFVTQFFTCLGNGMSLEDALGRALISFAIAGVFTILTAGLAGPVGGLLGGLISADGDYILDADNAFKKWAGG